jgi:hypothetical protein
MLMPYLCQANGPVAACGTRLRPGGMATVMQYTFSAAITLCPQMREDTAHRRPNEIRALAARACYLIQPRSLHEYFPAAISLAEGLPVPAGGQAVLTMALSDSEAEAFFAPRGHFTIWADGIVAAPFESRAGSATVSSAAVQHRARRWPIMTGSTGLPCSAGPWRGAPLLALGQRT